MLRRVLFTLVMAVVVGGVAFAEEMTGTLSKVEDGSITIQGVGKFNKEDKKFTKGEEKTFKVSKDVKITRSAGKDKDPVKLTLDELKTAMKVTNVTVTVTFEGENASEIKTGGFGGGGGKFGKDKKGKDDK